MKKGILLVTLILLMLISGCIDDIKEPDDTPIDDTPVIAPLDNATVTKLLEIYATVLDETFGAEFDLRQEPAFEDDWYEYYEVTNFRSKEEVISHLKQYMIEDLINTDMLGYDFAEKEGKLYAVRGARGYGYEGIDPSRWQKNGEDAVKVQFTILDEPQEGLFADVSFVYEDNVWKVKSCIIPEY